MRITRCEKSRFYPVLAKIRINRGLLYFHLHKISFSSLMLLFILCCIRVTSWFESQKCTNKPLP